ncbi:MAG: penicillin-binding protein activator LpoB, partial [Nitrospiraceae bacterium]
SRELTNSQKVTFVAGKGEREEIREERQEQAVHAREDTQKAPGTEVGADYMMKGNISTILDEADGVKAIFYQVDLEMIDLSNNVKTWFGQKKIKKVIERKRTLF